MNIFFPFLETHPDADPDQIASDYGFINIGQIGSLDHHYLFEHPKVHKRSIQKSHDLHFNLTNHPHIKWCEQQKELKRQEPMNYRTIMQTLFTLLTHCTLISLINVGPCLPILKISTLHKKKIHPPCLLIPPSTPRLLELRIIFFHKILPSRLFQPPRLVIWQILHPLHVFFNLHVY